MYEVTEGTQGSISAGHTFDPAHQEDVESLAVHGDVLYSTSRDFCIKKWDLSSKRQLQVLIAFFFMAHCGLWGICHAFGIEPALALLLILDQSFILFFRLPIRKLCLSAVRQCPGWLAQRSGHCSRLSCACERVPQRPAATLACRLASPPRRSPGPWHVHQWPGDQRQPAVHCLRVSHSHPLIMVHVKPSLPVRLQNNEL